MKTVAATAAAWVVALATTASPLGQQRATSAGAVSDTLVPGPADRVTLEQPANVFSAFNAFKMALDSANVRYGLEAVPTDPGAPPIDLARVREGVLTLGGRRLGDALDAIVREAPQYRWSEVEGTIVVRATPEGQGVLDRRVERFALVDAPPRAAMEAVIAALDPARAGGVGITGFGRPSGGAGGGPLRTGRNVTLDLKGATVQAILASIARENGDLSWTVRYDRPAAAVHSATITLTELGESVIAQSPASMEDQRTRQAPRAQLPIYVSLPTMVEMYARRAKVKVSIEQIAYVSFELPSFISLREVPPIELPDAPALAVPRIVALDSRYEWSERNGRFLVRPKAGVAGRLDVLDYSATGFSATNEPARSVIDRTARLVGMTFPQALSSRGRAAGGGSIEQAMSAPISVRVTSPATVRDILDAIADATGSTWMLQPRFTPGTPTLLMLQWRGGPALGGPPASSGWSTTTFITAFDDLSPTLMPTRAPVKAVPPALDRNIARVTIEAGSTSGPFQLFGSVVQAPMVVENALPSQGADPRYVTPSPPDIVVGPGKFSDALYALLEKFAGYEITSTEGVVGIAPTGLLQSRDYFMNQQVDSFKVESVGLFRAIGELRRRLDPGFQPADWNGPGQETWNRPVSVAMSRATPREILHELARQHRNVLIASSFADSTPTIDSWSVLLAPIDANGPPVRLTKEGGAVATTLPESLRPPMPPNPQPVRLVLPATFITLQLALGSAGRSTRELLGVELTVPAALTVPGVTALSDYYDLSGLSLGDMLRKIVELVPDYAYSFDNGVHHLRPRIPTRESAEWLAQRVDRIDQRFESVRDAMNAVVALGPQPQAPPPGAPGPPPPSGPLPAGRSVTPPTVPDRLAAQLQTPIVLALTNVTIRDVLDELARQHGALMWTVTARTTPTGTALSLSLSGYDGWTTSMSIR